MLKDEQDYFSIGGGDARPLKTWSDFSSVQYSFLMLEMTTMVKWWMVKWCNGEIKFSVIFYQIIRKKLVPNYQTNSKNIF